MKIYKVSAYSNCGTYFRPYLQWVNVIADSEKDALEKTEDCDFIKGVTRLVELEWDFEKDNGNIIEYHEDCDY